MTRFPSGRSKRCIFFSTFNPTSKVRSSAISVGHILSDNNKYSGETRAKRCKGEIIKCFAGTRQTSAAVPAKAGLKIIAVAENMENNSTTLIYYTSSGAHRRTGVEKTMFRRSGFHQLLYKLFKIVSLVFGSKLRIVPANNLMIQALQLFIVLRCLF